MLSRLQTICLLFFCTIILFSCGEKIAPESKPEEVAFDMNAHKQAMIDVMQKHLDAVTNKDLDALKSTLSPDNMLFLMLDQRETSKTADEFIAFHKEWFKDDNWSFETRITDTEVGRDLGLAITELIYREPERNGKPYFNRMAVSYVLKHADGKWSIIKDHATSIERAK